MKTSKKSKLLSAMLAILMVVTMFPVPVFAAEGDTATLVTNAADLSAGDQIVIVNSDGTYALSTDQKNNNRAAAEVTANGKVVTLTDSVQVITLEEGTVGGTFAFKTDAGYLYSASSSKNYLRSNAAKDDNGAWKIEIADSGVATIKSQGENTRNWLRFNPNNGSPIFAAYGNGQQDVAIYKLNSSSGGSEDPAPEEPAPEEPAGSIKDGDKVVIYAPAYGKALSTHKTGNYNVGVDVVLNGEVLSGYGETEIWTVIANDDGTFSFANGGQNIGMADSYSSMNLGAAHDDWELVPLENGLYNVKNTGRGNFIEWYAKFSNWSTYTANNAATDDQFQLAFYVIPEEPAPEEPETPAVPDGNYVIWAPGHNMALSSNYSGFYNSGVEVALNGDVLSGYGETEIWTVTNNEDGTISIAYNGQKLALADSYSSMTLGEKNDKWVLEEAGDGLYHVKNTGRGNYIEWYKDKNNWSSYYKISDESLFQLAFYAIPEENEGGKITSADQLVNGKYAMVIESGYAMGALDGSWITSVQPVIDGDKVTDAKGGVWTLVIDGEYVTITDSNGSSIAPKGGDANGIKSGSYKWNWKFNETNETFSFYGTDKDTVALASNHGSDYKFRAYKLSTINGNYASSYSAQFTLYSIVEKSEETTLPSDGDKVVIYNLSAQGVLAAENDTQSIESVLAEITDGKAAPKNGGVVFTAEKNGEFFRFHNETYGYLCSNGTGNNAFYSKEASNDADWKITAGKSGGWNLESRTAKFNGQYSQYLEYYADSYKTYSMYNVTDYDIYEFFFYPVAENVNVTEGIVNVPAIDFGTLYDAYIGLDYTFDFIVDAVFGVEGELTVKAGEIVLNKNDDGTYTIPAENISGNKITLTVKGLDKKGVEINGTADVTVKDEPVVDNVSPAVGTETKEDKRPEISTEIINAGEDAVITMTINGEEVEAVYKDGVLSYKPLADLPDGRTTVVVTVVRADGVTTEKVWSFTVGETTYQLYFGQLHSHTTYSDGSGSLDSALEYIKGLPESANVDFVAFTDHSNYFDSSSAVNPEGALYDMSLASSESQKLWNDYTGAMDKFNKEQSDVLALAGFEMTWSGGPGHINTFNTPGIVSRNNATLNNKTADAGMKAYYALLSQPEGVDSISQFNHPGSTFGTFTDFAYWDALIDTRIQLVEVGNGEGQIGAGGYYPSYEYYTMALDKGWHVAPTNNQDNHKGKWGNANEARDVILADALTEEAIYEAIRAMRMYSTEDKNLEIGYSVNGKMLGSSFANEEIPENLNIEVTVYDPDASDSISKVEVIVNSGKVVYTWDDPADLADGSLEATLSPDYSYYYIRVTEGDGDLAVTSPVWVGESLKLGISSVECGTSTPVTGEELSINTTLFNSENEDATVKSLTYTIGSQVIGIDETKLNIPASSTAAAEFKWTPSDAKVTKVTVTAVVEQGGTEYTFTMDIELDVQDADKLVYIGIDASHYNEYVNGNYKDSMGNFSALASENNVRTVQLNTSEELINACKNENGKYKAVILTAPSRRSAEAQSSNPLKVYTDEELAAIKAFNEAGGIVILAGWSDHYENYPDVQSIANMKAEEHMAATQNAVLEALGSSLRIGDDATYDDSYNGGQAYRLYFNTYGDSFLTKGVEVDPEHPHDRLYTEVFSHYGGASVYTVDGTLPSTVSPIVFGHSGTYSVDVDKDGLGGASMYKYACAEGDDRLMIMASEQLPGKGLIIVSGAAFMSNFEVQATIEDSGSEKNYSNYKICENLVAYINPVTVTPIAEVNAQTETGYKYTIEGVVTSNASGYDKDTAFFDCIYVQDETGGICCFPVAGNYKIGDKVRITGTTEFYQGEPELQVTSIEVIGEGKVEPKEVTAEQINNREVEGQLITVKGTVESFELVNGLIQTIMVKDKNGDVVRVFIDGYITTDKEVKNVKVGNDITVTGLASYDDTFNAPEGPFPRIRIRSREDVVCSKHVHVWGEWVNKVIFKVRECACGEKEYKFIGGGSGNGSGSGSASGNGSAGANGGGVVIIPGRGENESNPNTGAPRTLRLCDFRNCCSFRSSICFRKKKINKTLKYLWY